MNDSVLTERVFAETIAANGGRVYRVGGCVRDSFMGVTPKDIDFCVVGMVKKNFKTLFPDVEEYGKSFPVFRLLIDGVKCEVAFARTERKVGSGHKGFKVSSKPKVTIEEDLLRRDTTINSIAIDSLTGEIIDPFNGIRDIKDAILRATSQHFSEDPMRALRLAGQAARMGFAIENDTLVLAATVVDELANEPAERMLAEMAKVLVESPAPAKFFRVLADAHLLQTTFAEIANLSAEDFEKTMVILDAVAKVTSKPKVRFAALGLVLESKELAQWNDRMTLPGDWLDAAIAVGKTAALLALVSPATVVAAVDNLRRGSLSIEEFDVIAEAVGLNLPALCPLKTVMTSLSDAVVPKELKGKDISLWLRQKHIEAISKVL
ncbi:MAG: polynucleotide adenylyltransferase [Negativicutes bacterium]|nr:polynucleotide adenylyltransferase [Negativicutes bacterium]